MHHLTNSSIYFGWIPCLTGRLQFSYICPELALYDSFYISATSECFTEKHILVSSVYDWQDSDTQGDTGLFRVIVTGRLDIQNNSLYGQLFLLNSGRSPKNDEDYPLWAEDQKVDSQIAQDLSALQRDYNSLWRPETPDQESQELQNRVKENLISFSSEDDAETSPKKTIPSIYKRIEGQKFQYSYATNFKVSSDGITQINLSLSAIPSPSKETEYALSRISFYYLKYMLHHHAHHDDRADSITTIHVSPDGQKVPPEVLNDLKRTLVDIKRSKSQRPKGPGISAYTDSLLTSLQKRGELSDDEYERERIYVNNSGISLTTQQGHADDQKNLFGLFFERFIKALNLAFVFFTPLLLVAINKKSSSKSLPPENATATQESSTNEYVRQLINADFETIITIYIIFFSASLFIAWARHIWLKCSGIGIIKNSFISNLRFRSLSMNALKSTRFPMPRLWLGVLSLVNYATNIFRFRYIERFKANQSVKTRNKVMFLSVSTIIIGSIFVFFIAQRIANHIF